MHARTTRFFFWCSAAVRDSLIVLSIRDTAREGEIAHGSSVRGDVSVFADGSCGPPMPSERHADTGLP